MCAVILAPSSQIILAKCSSYRSDNWKALSTQVWHFMNHKCYSLGITLNPLKFRRSNKTSFPQRKFHIFSNCTAILLRWRHNGHDGVSIHQPHHCLLNRLFGCRSKKTSKLRVSGLCAGNSPGTGELPAQMASNAENVSIWWRYHVIPTGPLEDKYAVVQVMTWCVADKKPLSLMTHYSQAHLCVTKWFQFSYISCMTSIDWESLMKLPIPNSLW